MDNLRFKFRVWCRTLKQFQYFQFDLKEGSSLPHSNWYNEKEPIQQSIGRKDRNGKLIYEGDILLNDSVEDDKFYAVVKWDNQLAKFYLDDGENYLEIDDDGFDEIISNIYENKELLKEQK